MHELEVSAHWIYEVVVNNDYDIQRGKETLRIWSPALRAGDQIAITLFFLPCSVSSYN